MDFHAQLNQTNAALAMGPNSMVDFFKRMNLQVNRRNELTIAAVSIAAKHKDLSTSMQVHISNLDLNGPNKNTSILTLRNKISQIIKDWDNFSRMANKISNQLSSNLVPGIYKNQSEIDFLKFQLALLSREAEEAKKSLKPIEEGLMSGIFQSSVAFIQQIMNYAIKVQALTEGCINGRPA